MKKETEVNPYESAAWSVPPTEEIKAGLKELEGMLRKSLVLKLRSDAFGEAEALFDARFDRDGGGVPRMAEARAYVQRWTEMRRRGLGLLFWGPPGTGKTFAAAAIVNALCERVESARMLTLSEALSSLSALEPAARRYYYASLRSCGLLVLDNFVMGRRSDYALDQILSIIDGRCQSKKPVIVTTNLSLGAMKHPGSMAEERVFDRLLERCVPVCFDGESLRAARGRGNPALFRSLTA